MHLADRLQAPRVAQLQRDQTRRKYVHSNHRQQNLSVQRNAIIYCLQLVTGAKTPCLNSRSWLHTILRIAQDCCKRCCRCCTRRQPEQCNICIRLGVRTKMTMHGILHPGGHRMSPLVFESAPALASDRMTYRPATGAGPLTAAHHMAGAHGINAAACEGR